MPTEPKVFLSPGDEDHHVVAVPVPVVHIVRVLGKLLQNFNLLTFNYYDLIKRCHIFCFDLRLSWNGA